MCTQKCISQISRWENIDFGNPIVGISSLCATTGEKTTRRDYLNLGYTLNNVAVFYSATTTGVGHTSIIPSRVSDRFPFLMGTIRPKTGRQYMMESSEDDGNYQTKSDWMTEFLREEDSSGPRLV